MKLSQKTLNYLHVKCFFIYMIMTFKKINIFECTML